VTGRSALAPAPSEAERLDRAAGTAPGFLPAPVHLMQSSGPFEPGVWIRQLLKAGSNPPGSERLHQRFRLRVFQAEQTVFGGSATDVQKQGDVNAELLLEQSRHSSGLAQATSADGTTKPLAKPGNPNENRGPVRPCWPRIHSVPLGHSPAAGSLVQQPPRTRSHKACIAWPWFYRQACFTSIP